MTGSGGVWYNRKMGNQKYEIRNTKPSWGVTALPMLILISGIMIEIVIALALVAHLLSSSTYGARYAAEATIAAQAGLQDAAIRITRDKEYENTSGYALTIGNNTANIEVYKDRGKDGAVATGKHRVVSTGTARLFSKKIEGVYIVNDDTGEVILESYRELDF